MLFEEYSFQILEQIFQVDETYIISAKTLKNNLAMQEIITKWSKENNWKYGKYKNTKGNKQAKVKTKRTRSPRTTSVYYFVY